MRFAKTVAAVLFGVLVGVLASRSFHVKAAGGHLYVIRVNEGMNVTPILVSNQVVGFSCVAGDECSGSRFGLVVTSRMLATQDKIEILWHHLAPAIAGKFAVDAFLSLRSFFPVVCRDLPRLSAQ